MPAVLNVRDEGAARRYVFEQQAVVGRDPDCDIRLASRSVSRRHALVEKTPSGWVVRDLGSANGTSVDGARVSEAPLANGTAVRFGEVEGVFESEGRHTTSAERLLSSLSVAPARKARPVAVFLVTTAGVILLAAAAIWARYCDRTPAKARAASRAAAFIGT